MKAIRFFFSFGPWLLLVVLLSSEYTLGQCLTLTQSQSPNAVCSSGQFTFSLTNNGAAISATYTWYVWNGSSYQVIAGAFNNYYMTPTLSATKTYRAQVDYDGGCPTQYYDFTAQVNAPPTAPVPNNVALCGSGQAHPSVVYQSNYTYEWYENASGAKLIPNVTGTLSTGETYILEGLGYSGVNILNTSETLNFTVYATDQSNPNCGRSSTSVQVLVRPLPTVSAGASQSICITGGAISLSGTPSGGTWSGPGVSGTSFNPVTAGIGVKTLTYKYTDTYGCFNTSQKNMTVTDLTAPTTQNLVIAYNTSVTLTASGAGQNESYRWYSSSGNYLADGLTYTTGALTSSTSYSVAKYNTQQTTCESSSRSSLAVTTDRLPVVQAGADQSQTIPVASVTLTGSASDPDGTISNVAWSQLAGPPLTMAGNQTTTLTLTGLTVGTYTFRLTATDNYSLSAFDDINLSIVYPPNNYNYVREEVMNVAGATPASDFTSYTAEQKAMSTNYIDGLGRSMQTVHKQNSPSKGDVVQPVVYDDAGREAVKNLPYVSSVGNGDFKTTYSADQLNFYQTGNQTAVDAMPYAATVFESSPLHRILRQGAPGTTWQPNVNPNATDHAMHFQYAFNQASEVLLFAYDPSTGLVSTAAGSASYYNAGQLSVKVTTDEQGNDVVEYTDKESHLVCKKVQYQTDAQGVKQYTSTYYLYDDLGNLAVVLPPEAVKKIISQLN